MTWNWMPTPDAKWLPFMKMGFGFLLLLLLVGLAMVIALGHVEEKTSYGLQFILGGLSTLSGGYAQWAFSRPSTEEEKAEDRGKGKE